jgi:hypothetical protein
VLGNGVGSDVGATVEEVVGGWVVAGTGAVVVGVVVVIIVGEGDVEGRSVGATVVVVVGVREEIPAPNMPTEDCQQVL